VSNSESERERVRDGGRERGTLYVRHKDTLVFLIKRPQKTPIQRPTKRPIKSPMQRPCTAGTKIRCVPWAAHKYKYE
jgi:hypothetical protein